MIIDVCKPLNEGERLTVRIIMTIDEAHDAVTRPHELTRGILRMLVRHEEDKKR